MGELENTSGFKLAQCLQLRQRGSEGKRRDERGGREEKRAVSINIKEKGEEALLGKCMLEFLVFWIFFCELNISHI